MDDTTNLEFDDNRQLLELCGAHDRHLAMVEEGFGITITRRGNVLGLHGDGAARKKAADALHALYGRLEAGRTVEAGDVDAAVRLSNKTGLPTGEGLEIQTKRRRVEPRTDGQKQYVRDLLNNELVFGVGPAGSGKTYLAVAVGVAMFLERRVDKLILSRPAVEAGERLGFLPGDMKDKIDPYLRPLYDAINDLGVGAKLEKLIEDGRLEVAPLAFMRGRTLANAFIVLDEAQNTTEMQMRMFLTRLGENSRMVITGDPSQIDLPRGIRSGLDDALATLDGVKGVAIARMTDSDVVRHPLVARIVQAYARRDGAV
ncbi:MAG: PhoH family protein [Neomegalonema sp.]|nr:PhoH family protein [Neomegalonema sp.]